MKLSENFLISEFTASATADANGITNEPTKEHLIAMTALVSCTMQPVRNYWGRVVITSGYRSPLLNSIVGGSPTSQHALAEACDFHVPGTSCLEVAQWIVDSDIKFDQLIFEESFGEDGRKESEWCHISYSRFGDNRREVLSAKVTPGGTEYRQGLHEGF